MFFTSSRFGSPVKFCTLRRTEVLFARCADFATREIKKTAPCASAINKMCIRDSADPAHCGNAYKDVFAAFTPSGRAEIWCSAQDFTRGIEALCRAAAENTPNSMHYVFIENMEQNIPEQTLEDLIRLMRANTCVRVLVSVRKAISLPHGFQQKFPALVQNAACCTAKSGGIYISEDVFTVPPEDLPARRAAALSRCV